MLVLSGAELQSMCGDDRVLSSRIPAPGGVRDLLHHDLLGTGATTGLRSVVFSSTLLRL